MGFFGLFSKTRADNRRRQRIALGKNVEGSLRSISSPTRRTSSISSGSRIRRRNSIHSHLPPALIPDSPRRGWNRRTRQPPPLPPPLDRPDPPESPTSSTRQTDVRQNETEELVTPPMPDEDSCESSVIRPDPPSCPFPPPVQTVPELPPDANSTLVSLDSSHPTSANRPVRVPSVPHTSPLANSSFPQGLAPPFSPASEEMQVAVRAFMSAMARHASTADGQQRPMDVDFNGGTRDIVVGPAPGDQSLEQSRVFPDSANCGTFLAAGSEQSTIQSGPPSVINIRHVWDDSDSYHPELGGYGEAGRFSTRPEFSYPTQLGVSQERVEDAGRYKDWLTVFQATPLVYLDDDRKPQPIGVLDVEYERKILVKTFEESGNDIAVSFDIATTNQLGAFLARGEGRILHFSCHGHPEYLALEDGYGALHTLEVEQLKGWIASGGQRLQFVFVSACHSRSIGQAFVDAGVPHVVCCRQDSAKLRNDAAVKFESVFYYALAHGNVLRQAFELARRQIMVCSELQAQDRMAESYKYCLLPEGNDADHDVPIFFTEEVKLSQSALLAKVVNAPHSRSGRFPSVPDVFVGRNVDQFRVLQALKLFRFVRLLGPKGIGKSCLVKACCHWINERRQNIDIDEILWMPFAKENSGDALVRWFTEVFEKAMLEDQSTGFFSVDCNLCLDKIASHLRDKGALLILEAKNMSCYSRRKLMLFVGKLLKRTSDYKKDVKVILIDEEEAGDEFDDREITGSGKIVNIPKLDISGTIELFSRICPHVANRIDPDVDTPKKLMNLLMPRPPGPRLSKRLSTIVELIGDGIPSKIHSVSKRMTVAQYKRLVAIGYQEEVDVPLQSRAKLLKRIDEIESVYKTEDLESAEKLKWEYDEIKHILKEMPSLCSLERDLDDVQFEIQVARSERDAFREGNLTRKRHSLQVNMEAERVAMIELGTLQAHKHSIQRLTTRARLDFEFKTLEDMRLDMMTRGYFDRAKETKAKIDELEDIRPLRPTRQELVDYESRLSTRLLESMSVEAYDTADVINKRIKEIRNKILLENAEEKIIQTAGEVVAPPEDKMSMNDLSDNESDSLDDTELREGRPLLCRAPPSFSVRAGARKLEDILADRDRMIVSQPDVLQATNQSPNDTMAESLASRSSTGCISGKRTSRSTPGARLRSERSHTEADIAYDLNSTTAEASLTATDTAREPDCFYLNEGAVEGPSLIETLRYQPPRAPRASGESSGTGRPGPGAATEIANDRKARRKARCHVSTAPGPCAGSTEDADDHNPEAEGSLTGLIPGAIPIAGPSGESGCTENDDGHISKGGDSMSECDLPGAVPVPTPRRESECRSPPSLEDEPVAEVRAWTAVDDELVVEREVEERLEERIRNMTVEALEVHTVNNTAADETVEENSPVRRGCLWSILPFAFFSRRRPKGRSRRQNRR